jgi:hypothetical protein
MLFPNSNWRTEMQMVSGAIDETMGELVTIIPFILPKVNFPAVPDRLNPARTVTAVFKNKAKTVIMGNEGKIGGGHAISPLVETSEPIFEFSYDVLRSLPYAINQGYRIERCCDGAVYEVTNIKPDGVSRVCVTVVQLGRPSELT